MIEPDKIYTVKEVSTVLRQSERNVRRLIKNGTLKSYNPTSGRRYIFGKDIINFVVN